MQWVLTRVSPRRDQRARERCDLVVGCLPISQGIKVPGIWGVAQLHWSWATGIIHHHETSHGTVNKQTGYRVPK